MEKPKVIYLLYKLEILKKKLMSGNGLKTTMSVKGLRKTMSVKGLKNIIKSPN